MDVYAGDRQLPQDFVGFADDIIPFHGSDGILHDGLMTEILPTEIDHHSTLPPQKLRPVRSNLRNFSDYLDPTGFLNESMMSYGGVDSAELGFLAQQSAPETDVVDGAPKRDSTAMEEVTNCTFPENGGGNTSLPVGDPVAAAMQQMKSEINAECTNLISQARTLEAELSSPSDDSSESSGEATKEPSNRNRKRRTRKHLKLFLESLMSKVMEKQEDMHKQLLEVIEKKENERILREEAWKQQQIAKAERDEELRAQETSRSLALISFIQKFLGHKIDIYKSLETSYLENDDGEIQNQEDFDCDSSNRKWLKSEVQALIIVRTAMDQKFVEGPRGSLWEKVAAGLSNMGYRRTAKQCKQKWENMNKYYKRSRTTENGKRRLDDAKSCSYFHDLDILYRSGHGTPGNSSNYIMEEADGDSA